MFESPLARQARELWRGVFTLDPADPRLSTASMLALLEALDVSPEHVRLLSTVDVAALDEVSQLVALRIWSRVGAWVAAQEQLAIVAVAGSEYRGGSSESPDDWSAEEVGAALRLAPSTAGKRISAARELTSRLLDTWAALSAGRLSYWHAAHLAGALADHPDPVAAAVQSAVLPKAAGQTCGQFRRSVAQAIAAVDPASMAERHSRALRLSDVQVWAEADGMAALLARGPAPQIYEMYDRINWQAAAARTAAQRAHAADHPSPQSTRTTTANADAAALADAAAPPDAAALVDLADAAALPDAPALVEAEPSIGERRFDAFAGLMAGGGSGVREPGGPPGARRQVGILMDLPTAVGLADHPGEIPGYGPIAGQVARRLAVDADWQAWITDAASGQLTALGTQLYRPSRRLRNFIEARDRTCMHPGCARAAWRCDIDHALPYDAGGCTDATNCGCFCRRHHRLKPETEWTVRRHPDGTVHWKSPLRQEYTVHPADYRWMMRPADPPDPPDPPVAPDTEVAPGPLNDSPAADLQD